MRTSRLRIVFLIVAAALAAMAQTKIDMRTQTKGGSTGGSGPGTGPSPGSVTAVASPFGTTANIPACSSGIANDLKPCGRTGDSSTYVNQGSGSRTPGNALVYDLRGNAIDGGLIFTRVCIVVKSSPTTLTIAPGASIDAPCAFTVGNNRVAFNAPSTVVIGGGTGVAWFSYDILGQNIKVTLDGVTVVSCSGCVTSTGPSAPTLHIPFWKWPSTLGTWDDHGTSLASEIYGGYPVVCSTGLACANNSDGTQTVAFDTAVLPMKLTTVAALSFPAVPAGACADAVTPLAGSLLGDVTHVGPPPSIPGGSFATAFVPIPGSITVRLCNLSGSALGATSGSYSLQITR